MIYTAGTVLGHAGLPRLTLSGQRIIMRCTQVLICLGNTPDAPVVASINTTTGDVSVVGDRRFLG